MVEGRGTFTPHVNTLGWRHEYTQPITIFMDPFRVPSSITPTPAVAPTKTQLHIAFAISFIAFLQLMILFITIETVHEISAEPSVLMTPSLSKLTLLKLFSSDIL